MTARTTMANLIGELRGMTDAGADDYTIGLVAYWTDDQLQAILDRNRIEVANDALTHIDEYADGGVLTVTRYYSHFGNYEATSGGTAIFVVRDGTWNTVGTALYTADYQRGEVIFSSATGAAPYYLTGRSYDLNAAAADVWERKAAQSASASYSWSSDNMRVDKGAMRKDYIEQARYYRARAGVKSVSVERGDC